jgi:hypothetical protein
MIVEANVAGPMAKHHGFSEVFDSKKRKYQEKWSGIKVADFERGSLGSKKILNVRLRYG